MSRIGSHIRPRVSQGKEGAGYCFAESFRIGPSISVIVQETAKNILAMHGFHSLNSAESLNNSIQMGQVLHIY
jgi:hypothetical protein